MKKLITTTFTDSNNNNMDKNFQIFMYKIQATKIA